MGLRFHSVIPLTINISLKAYNDLTLHVRSDWIFVDLYASWQDRTDDLTEDLTDAMSMRCRQCRK